MDTGKPTKTLADYLVIAISPALIMVLVYSVCFFLVEVFYRGEAAGGARWVLFWFVLAAVLIARIGIEQGTSYALGYGLFLAFAVWIYLFRVQSNPVLGAILLGLVWFTAHKLTSNCTLIDDDDDASGQGLLQSLHRLPSWLKKQGGTGDPPVPSGDSPDGTERVSRTKTGPHLAKPFPSPSIGGPPAGPGGPPPLRPAPKTTAPVPVKKKGDSQPPGIWLIYFSLAALPIFGLGQTLLPAGDVAARHASFVYLFLYLAAALGLLVTTSFLGLRRYLRQRFLAMPDFVAFGWMQVGVVAAALVLCLSLLVPRPGAGQVWGALRYHVDHQLRRASEYAARFNPHGTGSGRAGDQAPPAGQPGQNPPPPGPASGPDQNPSAGQNGHGDQQSGADASHGTPAGKAGGDHPGKSLPNLSPAAGTVYSWLKPLFWLAVALGLLWLCYRYRAAVMTMLRNLWTAIRDFIAGLLGLFRPPAVVPPELSKIRDRPPFKTFKNPFLTGGSHLWAPEKLIAYSYDALQSWALETEPAPGSPRTPRELCRQLGDELPEAKTALDQLAFFYGHVAYGASLPAGYNPDHLRRLWDLMSSPRPHSAGAVSELQPAGKT